MSLNIPSSTASVAVNSALSNVGKESVNVIVRCRPLLPNELNCPSDHVLSLDTVARTAAINAMGKKKEFSYDAVLTEKSTQVEAFQAALPIVSAALEGLNGTIFAYGQTSSGKTHTMMGDLRSKQEQGIIPNVVDFVFDHVHFNTDDNTRYLIMASFLEIYNEQVRDLLGKNANASLEVRQNTDMSFFVPDLSRHIVANKSDLLELIQRGNENRTVAETHKNTESSRSHSMLTLYVEKMTGRADDSAQRMVAAKLNLVDLAGSERLDDTKQTSSKETCAINQSLTCLANVISALTSDKPNTFIPYRDSKLTRLLKDSLGGNARTLMIACVNPNPLNANETMSTLRYAARAKKIKNKPKVNEDPKDAMMRTLEEEINKLKQVVEQKKATSEEMLKLIREMTASTHIYLSGDKMRESGADVTATQNDIEERVKFLNTFIQVPNSAKRAAVKWARRTFGKSLNLTLNLTPPSASQVSPSLLNIDSPLTTESKSNGVTAPHSARRFTNSGFDYSSQFSRLSGGSGAADDMLLLDHSQGSSSGSSSSAADGALQEIDAMEKAKLLLLQFHKQIQQAQKVKSEEDQKNEKQQRTLAQVQAELGQTKTKLAETETRLATEVQKSRDLSSQLEAKGTELEHAKESHKRQLSNERQKNQFQVSELQTKLQAVEQSECQSREKCKAYEEQIAGLAQQAQGANAAAAAAEEVEGLRSQLQQLTQQHQGLELQHQGLEQQLSESKAREEALQQSLQRTEQEQKQQHAAVANAERLLQELAESSRAKVEESERKVSALTLQLTEAQAQLQKQQDSQAQLAQAQQELEQVRAEHKRCPAAGWELKMKDACDRAAVMTLELKNKERELIVLQKEVDELRSRPSISLQKAPLIPSGSKKKTKGSSACVVL